VKGRTGGEEQSRRDERERKRVAGGGWVEAWSRGSEGGMDGD